MSVTPTFSRDVDTRDGSIVTANWSLTTANPDGIPLDFMEWADRTWQAFGTWGGAILTLQGSNDGGTTWFALTNAAGGSATLSGNGGLATIELPLLVRPNLTTVGSGATVTVIICARRANPMRT